MNNKDKLIEIKESLTKIKSIMNTTSINAKYFEYEPKILSEVLIDIIKEVTGVEYYLSETTFDYRRAVFPKEITKVIEQVNITSVAYKKMLEILKNTTGINFDVDKISTVSSKVVKMHEKASWEPKTDYRAVLVKKDADVNLNKFLNIEMKYDEILILTNTPMERKAVNEMKINIHHFLSDHRSMPWDYVFLIDFLEKLTIYRLIYNLDDITKDQLEFFKNYYLIDNLTKLANEHEQRQKNIKRYQFTRKEI